MISSNSNDLIWLYDSLSRDYDVLPNYDLFSYTHGSLSRIQDFTQDYSILKYYGPFLQPWDTMQWWLTVSYSWLIIRIIKILYHNYNNSIITTQYLMLMTIP